MTTPGLILLLTLQVAAAQPAVGDAEWLLTFQVRPDVRRETLDLIARVSQARETTLESPATLEMVAKAEYGTTFKHMKNLRQWNVAAAQAGPVLAPGTEVALPAAPEWRFNEKVIVPEGLDLDAFVCSRLGTCGRTTIAAVQRVNKAKFETLEKRRTIVLPYQAPIVTAKLKDIPEEELERILAAIASDPAVERVEINRGFELVEGLEGTDLASGACAAGAAPSVIPDRSALAALPAPKRQAVVAILDSGIPRDDTRFAFWENASEKGGVDEEDDDGNHITDDVIGTDILKVSHGGGFPEDDVDVPRLKNHGTHVAGIASGRPFDDDTKRRIDERVRLMILKVANSIGRIEPGAVSDATAYAVSHGARIVNMSFAGDEFSPSTQWTMETSPSVLFVTAAGNSRSAPRDLSQTKVFPAKYATDLPNVIAVAASEAAPKLACFSNYGSEVDLAAPGVSIVSTMRNGTGALSGTSQATPWVTLTAALLYSMASEFEPATIRSRILNTVDFSPALVGKVLSEGTLNMGKALAFTDDLVVRTDGTLLRGRIEGAPAIAIGCGDSPRPISDIARIVVDRSSVPARGRVTLNPSRAACVGDLPLQTLAFREHGNAVATLLQVDEIAEVIPRTRFR